MHISIKFIVFVKCMHLMLFAIVTINFKLEIVNIKINFKLEIVNIKIYTNEAIFLLRTADNAICSGDRF